MTGLLTWIFQYFDDQLFTVIMTWYLCTQCYGRNDYQAKSIRLSKGRGKKLPLFCDISKFCNNYLIYKVQSKSKVIISFINKHLTIKLQRNHFPAEGFPNNPHISNDKLVKYGVHCTVYMLNNKYDVLLDHHSLSQGLDKGQGHYQVYIQCQGL